jgi:hypothetical protein
MDGDMSQNDKADRKPETELRVWTPPTITEIDYAQTEASFTQFGGPDLGMYTV